MAFQREPTVIIGGLAEIARAIIPMMIIFGLLHWTDQQTAQVILVIGVAVGVAEKMFVRSQVVSTDTANKQIETAIKSPTDTTVAEVVAITKEKEG